MKALDHYVRYGSIVLHVLYVCLALVLTLTMIYRMLSLYDRTRLRISDVCIGLVITFTPVYWILSIFGCKGFTVESRYIYNKLEGTEKIGSL